MKFFQRRTATDARAEYRVQGARAPLDVVLVLDGVARPVTLVDVAAGGCAVRAPRAELGSLTEGTEVALRFGVQRAAEAPKHVYARAAVRNLRAYDGDLRVGLQFLDRERVWSQLDDGLWRTFNRRQAFRIGPGPEEVDRTMVRLAWGERSLVAPLHDISTGGLAVRLAATERLEVPREGALRAVFELPVAGGPFDLVAAPVHDTRVRGTRRLGLRFDPDANPDLQREQERILQYVLGRQRAVLQQRRGERVPTEVPPGAVQP